MPYTHKLKHMPLWLKKPLSLRERLKYKHLSLKDHLDCKRICLLNWNWRREDWEYPYYTAEQRREFLATGKCP